MSCYNKLVHGFAFRSMQWIVHALTCPA